ncbi:hypothetical protein BWQ96_03881 [Gracilariopsis chorda]|uniref:SAM domain-containing protein n=1 Tax=Gracilariopsis chorda TaxID=448386 RepID=A0A2V3IW72_9FLOR|nr:hypothetical protein BWQ96_03881 [Gracilariopsis chorda]|eukprot:PXF46382.1 hypothetical protein BWQ96_03881 [Gracilariopsis chorda]
MTSISYSLPATTRRLKKLVSPAPTAVAAGLRTYTLFENMDSTEEVVRWLFAIGMQKYTAAFRTHAVTGSSLLSLNTIELSQTLGVSKLKDRRIILEGIAYLRQTLSSESRHSIPEDGRILTHLSNERVFLSWLRLAIILQTVAIATVRLENPVVDRNVPYIKAFNIVLSVLAILIVIYGTARYFWMHRMIENPGEDHIPENNILAIPLLVVFAGIVIGLYAVLAQETEEAALLALIAV